MAQYGCIIYRICGCSSRQRNVAEERVLTLASIFREIFLGGNGLGLWKGT